MSAGVVALLIIPATIPAEGNWITGVREPPTIFTGGANVGIVSSDWKDTFSWIKNNTPEDAVIASWWDYGYWITTEGERRSLADNWTADDVRIANIAGMFLSTPDEAWLTLQELQADYVLIFVAAHYIEAEPPLYFLNGGGDEQKNYWFIRIAEEPLDLYLYPDIATETDHFWENTILGQMIPFSPLVYFNTETGAQTQSWQPGSIELAQKEVKLLPDGDGPLRLAYASPSFYAERSPVIGVFVYEVNKEYVPGQSSPETAALPQQSIDLAVVSTGLGEILVQLDGSADPRLVSSFVQISEAGAFDGTTFHRVVPGVLMQAGDPATAKLPPASGAGGAAIPGEPTLSGLGGTKYLLAVARGDTLSGPDPQFFIINSEVPWIAGDYTVFGSIINGEETVDAIAALETGEGNRPIDTEASAILQIRSNALLIP